MSPRRQNFCTFKGFYPGKFKFRVIKTHCFFVSLWACKFNEIR